MIQRHKVLTTFLIFFFSLLIHCIGLNQEGRTWDEQFKVDMGFDAIQALRLHDYSDKAWNEGTDYPMVAKYIYGFASLPQTKILSLSQRIDAATDAYLQDGNYFYFRQGNLVKVSNYDFTLPRLVSAAANSLTVALTYWITLSFIPNILSLIPPLILLATPRFLAMGRLMTYEALSDVFYMLLALCFAYLLRKNQTKTHWYILTGILCGLLFWTRYNNIHALFFLAGWWIFWFLFHQKQKPFFKDKAFYNWRLVFIPIVAFCFGVAIWPFLWHNFLHGILSTFTSVSGRTHPSFYHWMYFLYTTPVFFLLCFFIGLIVSLREKAYRYWVLNWAFLSIFLFYSMFAGYINGTRYMFIIYPVYAILSGIGIQAIFGYLSKRFPHNTTFIFTGMFCLISMQSFFSFQIHPYYLDYYNLLVGGLSGAVTKHLEISWWGEGQREAGLWVNANAPAKSSLALDVTPKYVYPRSRNDIKEYNFGEKIGETDFLVVSQDRFALLSPTIQKQYQLVYTVGRQGVTFIYVLERNHI